jgi:hypothetical protein
MSVLSYKVSDNLYLVKSALPTTAKAQLVEVPTDQIFVVDCSGSMWGDLSKVREHLKKKLPKMISEKDTVSIVWFSGRGQCGILLEAEPVATLTDLANVNKAIDRWLQPQGLTGFKEPLELVAALARRLQKSRPEAARALTFMSDGHDNQWSRPDILKAVEEAGGLLSAATFVEYGYYADRNLLSAMAEKAGGAHIFSESFDKYVPVLEAAFGKKVTGAPKVEVVIGGDAVGGFAFAVDDGEILTFAVEGGKVKVPENLKAVAYLSSTPQGPGVDLLRISKDGADPDCDSFGLDSLTEAYAALSLYATRMNSNVVFALLKSLGDVALIEQFASCFGKQAYSAFQQSAKLAATNPNLRLTKGYDPNRVPREDAFTVLELLHVLSNDEGNRLMLDHSGFKYSRIGRGRVDSSTLLTAEEQAQVDALTEELKTAKGAKKLSELAGKIAAITEGKEALKFEALECPDGYEVNGLVWNEERPNVSVRVVKQGTVDISGRCPDTLKATVPQAFPSFIFRNYTIIKDGLVNVEVLPVKLTQATQDILVKAIDDGRAPKSMMEATEMVDIDLESPSQVLLNLKDLPVINRQMVKSTSAKKLFELEWEITKARAAQKVFKAYKDDLLGKRKSEGYVEKYGQEAADWLKEQGFTDYSGFSPKAVQAEATDFYISKEMSVSIKSFSSLPSLKQAREKKAKGKLTASESLMVRYIDFVDSFLQGDHYKTSANQKRMLEGWLDEEAKAAVQVTRDLIFKKAQLLFSVLVGQSWFQEFASLDENSMEIELEGQKLSCKVEMRENQVSI